MQKKLSDVASILRSKNAGPYMLTVDFLFDDKETYEKVKLSNVLDEESIAGMYKVSPENLLL